MSLKKYHSILILLFFSIFFMNCKKEDKNKIDEAKIVEQMKNMSSLGTVEYSFSKLIKSSDEQSFAFGDRKILMSCKAYAKAGVNFEKLSVTTIDAKNKSIQVVLPKGELILLNIPANEIKILNQNVGFFRDKFSNSEIQSIQVLAEKDIKSKMAEFKITDKAESNAKIFLDKWLRNFGFTSVKIDIN